jgi:hypothetical protein
MSLDPNVSTEINHTLPFSHSGVLLTKSTLWQRAEDSCHTVERMGESRGQVRLTTQLLQGLYTTTDESLPISIVSRYDSCADMS